MQNGQPLRKALRAKYEEMRAAGKFGVELKLPERAALVVGAFREWNAEYVEEAKVGFAKVALKDAVGKARPGRDVAVPIVDADGRMTGEHEMREFEQLTFELIGRKLADLDRQATGIQIEHSKLTRLQGALQLRCMERNLDLAVATLGEAFTEDEQIALVA